MPTMSTFGTFNMARLGIYVAQQALTVTGNNITNINTEGYSRQQLDQIDLTIGAADRYQSRLITSYSAGVMENGVNQLRDPYLDIRYRNEQTEVGSLKATVDGLGDLKYIMDEVAKGEDGEGNLEARFNEFIQAMENLHAAGAFKEADETVARSTAKALTDTLNDYAKRVRTVKETQTVEFQENVDHVNTVLTRIRDLSSAIRKTEIYGGVALTQRDERNKLIDELSEYIGIDVTTEMETVSGGLEVERMMIRTSGEPKRMLLDGVFGAQLAIRDQENFGLDITELKSVKGYPDPRATNEMVERVSSVVGAVDSPDELPKDNMFKEELNGAGLKKAQQVVEQLNSEPRFYTDSGDPNISYYYSVSEVSAGGGIRYAVQRCTCPVCSDDAEERKNLADPSTMRYMDVAHEGHCQTNDTELSGSLQAQRELLTESGEYTWADSYPEDDLNFDSKAPIKRGIPYYEKALDLLASTFAQMMNDANNMRDTDLYLTNAEGKLVGKGNVEITTDSEGKLSGTPIPKPGFEHYFEKDEAGEYVTGDDGRLVVKDEYKSRMGGNLFSNSGINNDGEGITAANISVAVSWADGNMHLLQSKKADFASGDQDNIAHMIVQMTTDQDFVLPRDEEHLGKRAGAPIFRGTFQEMFTENITGVMADDIMVAETLHYNHSTTANELFVERDGIMGVDLNDEAMNMMQYSKAYSAACRLMTTFDEMLEKLVNGTAV